MLAKAGTLYKARANICSEHTVGAIIYNVTRATFCETNVHEGEFLPGRAVQCDHVSSTKALNDSSAGDSCTSRRTSNRAQRAPPTNPRRWTSQEIPFR